MFLNTLKILCMNHALFEVFLVCRYDKHMFDENKKLDFDSAMRLAQDNPDAFEQYRREAIDGLLARIPVHNQERLRRLQWRIDQERKLSGNAMSACVRIYEMMWDSFAGDRGLVGQLHHLQDLCSSSNVTATTTTARILSFEHH